MKIEIDKDGNIREIIVKKYRFKTKPIPPTDSGRIIETFKVVEEILNDISIESTNDKWDEDSFIEFAKELTDYQRLFLIKCLDGWIPTTDILKEFKNAGLKADIPQVVSGLRSGITKKLKKTYKKENIIESKWNNKENQNYYRIKPQYIELVKKILLGVQDEMDKTCSVS